MKTNLTTKEIRRSKVAKILEEATNPYTALELGEMVGVTRQTIVVDISLLRADGYNIKGGYHGYYIPNIHNTFIINVKHDVHDIEKELKIIVSNGARVLDINVEHPNYGNLTGTLDIGTLKEVHTHLNENQTPLLILGGEIHSHRILCDSRDHFLKIKEILTQENLWYDKEVEK